MKRNIITVLFALFAMLQAGAQTYDNLWKQVDALRKKDLPKSEITILQKIANKASIAKDYGQLLAAEMRQAILSEGISPDSASVRMTRLEAQAEAETDPMLKAVRYATLGKLASLFAENSIWGISLDTSAEEYFKKSLENPDILARHYSTEYVPLTLKGMDGSTFNNDMLHLIGFEADTKEAYQKMYTYYNKVGNRGAACLCAFEITQKDRQADTKKVRKSKYLNTIDSLIHVYQDIPQAGELAVEHYRFMEGTTDATAQDKLNYINYALSRWGGWSRMNVLRNAQKELTEPMFEVNGLQQVIHPNQKKWLKVKVRNLQNLNLSLSRIDITADNHYDVNDEATYKMLMKKTTPLHQNEKSMQFYGHPNYEFVKDSIEIADLPLGAYLMEISSDNASIKPKRQLFYVSDLALMSQQLPDDKYRYVVVSATTGQPIPEAKILILDSRYDSKSGRDKRVVRARLTTDDNGEAYIKNIDGDVLVTTTTDKYTPAEWIYLSRIRYYEQKDTAESAKVYTDRAIYRPGQTIHVTAVRFVRIKGLDAKVQPKMDGELELRDSRYQVVATQKVKTDAYGTVSADFVLPKNAEPGKYIVNLYGERNQTYAVRTISVEEYKRPTFEITFPKVNQKYNWGDTVVVKATAKTYAGVPVQGAKVSYSVTRRNSLWWWNHASANEVVKNGTGTTRDDGTFDVEIPLEPVVKSRDPENIEAFLRTARFYQFDVQATVTDESGESHAGEMSLPLGTKATAFSCDLPRRIETDSLKQVTFSYRNASGMEIGSELRYRIDNGEWKTALTNVPIAIKEYAFGKAAVGKSSVWTSGAHLLEAVCEKDTLQQKFVLFSMADTHPMEKTVHWSYQTSETFSCDGKPVYVQIGSSENGVHIVYSIIAGNQLLEKGAWEIGDSIITFPFTYKPEYQSGIVINYCFVKEGKCYFNKMRIARPLPEKKLNVTWKTFRNRLTPGQKEEWTLNISTPDGKPAKAQLLSVLYDKSLDQLMKHTWEMSLGFYQTLPNCYWKNNLYPSLLSFSGTYPTKYYGTAELEVDKFSPKIFEYYEGRMVLCESVVTSDRTVQTSRGTAQESKKVRVRALANAAPLALKKDMDIREEAPLDMAAGTEAIGASSQDKTLDQVQVRENLNETAFFYPALESDAKGNVHLKFTLPESLTTWKFMGLAHDKEMRNGLLTDEVVAQKTVMVQPNLPRFLREGDKAVLVAKVFNTSEKKVNGEARMQIIDPETNKVVWQKLQKYNVDANGTATINFDVEGLQEGTYINKVVVSGNGYSDGEQHYLPVLSDKEIVVNTFPITLHEAGKKDFDLSRLFLNKDGKQVKADKDMKVTVEYTNNPSWLMMKALPAISNPTDEDALSLMAAIYANTLSRHVQKTTNVNAKDINDASGLTSASDTLLAKVKKYVALLKKLQNKDGSFSWWKGMSGSRYMTTTVAEMMVRLNAIVDKQSSTASMLSGAIGYLRQQTACEVKKMKEEEAKAAQNVARNGKKNEAYQATPSELALYYLYVITMDDTKLNAADKADKTYLLGKLEKMTSDLTIFGKAKAAMVLAKNQKPQVAADYLKSIEEYSVYREDMGRYYDTRKAYYSWRNYKIPTEVAAIEAFQALSFQGISASSADSPIISNQQIIEEMQRWLLMSKRTQAWDNPVNTVDAVYAFMQGNEQNWNRKAENAVLKLDGKNLEMPKDSTTLGYVKVERKGNAQTLTVDKKSNYTSWGAVYAEFKQPISEISAAESGIKISRKIVAVSAKDGGEKKISEAKKGDKLKVVLTLNADHDYDFVRVVDKRAACLEPVNQLSGYQWGLGCYVSPRDYTTNFYFERLSKGKHVVEMEYYVDREGDYRAGSCTVECTYSPEFGGRTEGYQMNIKK